MFEQNIIYLEENLDARSIQNKWMEAQSQNKVGILDNVM